MKKLLLVAVAILVGSVASIAKDTPNPSPNYDNVYGKMRSDLSGGYGIMETPDFKGDMMRLYNGSEFLLLDHHVYKNPNYNLMVVKAKVTYCAKGEYKGRVGWINVIQCDLEDYYNESTLTIEKGDYTARKTYSELNQFPSEYNFSSGSSSSSGMLSGKAYLNQVETVNTGISGKVTYDGAFLRIDNFEDYDTSIPSNTSFELLNTQMVEDASELPCMKIKITSGSHNGKIGYMYPALTNLTDYVNYGNNRIEGAPKGGSSSSKGSVADLSGKAYLNQVETVNTGITGKVTYDGAFLRIDNFNDFDTAIDEGTPFKLLNRQMAEDDVPLPCMKIEITAGKHSGKIGYMYPALTTLTDRVNYTTNRID